MKLKALLKHLPEELGVLIARRLSNLSRFAKIGHELIYVDASKKVVTFEARQINRMTDTIYTLKEMNDFFREHLTELEQAGWKLLINPKKYEVTGLDFVTVGWVKDKMHEYGTRQAQIVQELDLDKQVISKLMTESFGFTRWHKAAFYYYFKCMELSKELEKKTWIQA